MSSQIQVVKEKLDATVKQPCDTSWMFVKDPRRDFTRDRKLPFREVISVLLCMEGGSLTGELLRHFGCIQHTASSSAFIQQRQKLNEFAFPSLFDLFVKNTDKERLYKGYRLFAADGSDIRTRKHTNGFRQPTLLTSCHSPAKSMIRFRFTIFLSVLLDSKSLIPLTKL